MKKIILAFLFIIASANVFAQTNIVLRSQKTYSGDLSNIGGIAINNREFALVGWQNGLSIVDVTNPDSIFQVINIPGASSAWREVKTFNNYAYVTTEATGDGLIIVNLNIFLIQHLIISILVMQLLITRFKPYMLCILTRGMCTCMAQTYLMVQPLFVI